MLKDKIEKKKHELEKGGKKQANAGEHS